MPESPASPSVPFPLIVIGGSAGGFEGIKKICAGLPADLGGAVLIVWHMSAQTEGFLPLAINRNSPLHAKNAVDHEKIRPNQIYVAPPDHHLTVYHNELRVTRGPKENRFRPAIDPLFRSAAYFAGRQVTGVILSGFLDDGSSGLWAVKHFGGKAIVQHPDDAEVPAMPLNALKVTPADYTVPVVQIAGILTGICKAIPRNADMATVSVPEHLKDEIEYAMQENFSSNGASPIGELSPYSCPDCKGVLSAISEGPIKRYRCHTGHAYTAQNLLEALRGTLEESLYSALRALEERMTLLKDLMSQEAGTALSTVHEAELSTITEKTDMLHAVLDMEG